MKVRPAASANKGDCKRYEPDQHATRAFLIEIEDGQVSCLLALRSELRIRALAPPQADRNQREAEQERHRQQDEGDDAEIGTALEAHALHEQQHGDEQEAHQDQQGADQADDVAGNGPEKMLDHRMTPMLRLLM
ncbi:MAG: hypothetical protein IPF50_17305 [Proteobacteria bacterium]|nr:hypothetical protein [Pseudomonadota bacterium]